MDLVLSAKNQDLKKSCASGTVGGPLAMCPGLHGEKDRACAEAAYGKLEKKLKPDSVRYQMARGYFVENAPNNELKRDGYERLLAEFVDSPQALAWAGIISRVLARIPRPPRKSDSWKKFFPTFQGF